MRLQLDVVERWGLPVVKLSEEDFVSLPVIESAVYLIVKGGVQIPIAIRRASIDRAVFVFHGAKDRKRFSPPIFEGMGLSEALDATAILFSDPILSYSDDITIGWFAGTAQLNLQKVLRRYLRIIEVRLGLARRFFVGGSGGGFAALYYGIAARADLVFAMSPQIVISRHNKAAVSRYFQIGFGVDGEESVSEEIAVKYCWDIRRIWPRELQSRVCYLQNTGDRRHMEYHLAALLEVANDVCIEESQRGTGLNVILRHWADGHASAPKSLVMSELKRNIELL